MDKEIVREAGTVRPEDREGTEHHEGNDSPEEAPEEPGRDTSGQDVRKLYKELKKWKERYRELQARWAQIEAREKELQELKGRLADMHVTRLLTDAASAQDAIDPRQVASFLRDRVVLNDDLTPVALPASGDAAGAAGPATVEELVREFLSRHPFHRKAKLAGGSGSAPRPTAAAQTLIERIRSAGSHDELEKIVTPR